MIEKYLHPSQSKSAENIADMPQQNEDLYVSIEDESDQNGFAVVSTKNLLTKVVKFLL